MLVFITWHLSRKSFLLFVVGVSVIVGVGSAFVVAADVSVVVRADVVEDSAAFLFFVVVFQVFVVFVRSEFRASTTAPVFIMIVKDGIFTFGCCSSEAFGKLGVWRCYCRCCCCCCCLSIKIIVTFTAFAESFVNFVLTSCGKKIL